MGGDQKKRPQRFFWRAVLWGAGVVGLVGCAVAVWRVNVDAVEAGGRLSLTDTHWPGEWPNLLCPDKVRTGCTGGGPNVGWPRGLPLSLDAGARNRLAQYPWAEAAGGGRAASAAIEWPAPVFWVHGLVGVYERPQDRETRTVLLVYASKFPAWECHACAPWASFFEFEADHAGHWRLKKAALGAAQQGAWGQLAPIHVLPLSEHQMGVWFAMGYTAQGFTAETLTAYAWSGARLLPVWEELVGERDGNEHDVSWQARWRFGRSMDGRLTVDLWREPGPHVLSGSFMRRNDGPSANGTDAAGQLTRSVQWQFDGERFVAAAITN